MQCVRQLAVLPCLRGLEHGWFHFQHDLNPRTRAATANLKKYSLKISMRPQKA